MLPAVSPLQARIGDIGVIALPLTNKRDAEHVGVHTGRAWAVKTEDGLRTFDVIRAKAAFRVG